MSHRRNKSEIGRGFMIAEVLTGLAFVTMLGTMLVCVLTRMHRASDRLADDRTALRRAESVLLDLQAGKPFNSSENKDVHLRSIEGFVPPGQKWVWISATYNGREAGLAGLTPQSWSAGRSSP